MNIYVSNLSYNTTSESLQNLFAEYGEVTSVNVVTDRETGRPRGFAFVEMPDNAEGQKAIDELNETEFEGKTLNVNVARPKTERSSGGGYNRGGGGGYNSNRGGGGYNSNRGGGRDGGGYNRRQY
jgi:RNA recognition motif-containing protein